VALVPKCDVTTGHAIAWLLQNKCNQRQAATNSSQRQSATTVVVVCTRVVVDKVLEQAADTAAGK